MAPLFPARPTRARADLGRELTSYTTQVIDPTNPRMRDWPIANPWIPSAVIGVEGYQDERHWVQMETNPAISGSMAMRIAQLVGGGVKLEPGEGPGASELFDFWSFVLGEHPLTKILCIAFRSMFRGWECFEVVGGFRDWEGRRVFVPVVLRDALTWQFRFTASRDLIYCPGGINVRGYRRDTLPAKMKFWTPVAGATLSNPYGYPLHYFASTMEFAARTLSQAFMVQANRAQGFLKVKHSLDINDPKLKATVDHVVNTIKEWQATGVLIEPMGFETDWIDLVESVGSGIELLNWFDNSFRTFYQGGSLTTAATGASGNRALGEVMERQGQRLSSVDALQAVETFRSDFLRPWSAQNATLISRDFRATAATPRLEDVPLRAVPHLSFSSLHRIRPEDLAVLQALIGNVAENKEGAEVEPVRPDVRRILELSRIPLLDEGEEGPTIDLTRREPRPEGFEDQALGLGNEREEADEDPLAEGSRR